MTTRRVEKERRKLIAAVREMVGLLHAAELVDLIEHIKDVMKRTDGAAIPSSVLVLRDGTWVSRELCERLGLATDVILLMDHDAFIASVHPSNR